MVCSLPGSSVHGILQARILEWVAIPFSRGSSWPRDRTRVSRIAGRFFTIWATNCLLMVVLGLLISISSSTHPKAGLLISLPTPSSPTAFSVSAGNNTVPSWLLSLTFLVQSTLKSRPASEGFPLAAQLRPGLLATVILCLNVCSGALSPCLGSVTSQHSSQWSFKNKSQIERLLPSKLCHGTFSSAWKSLWRLGNLQLPIPSAFQLRHRPLHPPGLFHTLWSLCCSSNTPNTLTRQGLCTGCHPCLTHSTHKNRYD